MTRSDPAVEISAACSALGGGVSGDTWATFGSEDCLTLLVVDGVGHGAPAAAVAQRARNSVASVLASDIYLPLDRIMHQCHVALRGTRGAVVALCRFEPPARRLSFCGVGNIGVKQLPHRHGTGVSLPGTVGSQMRTVRVFSSELAEGDLLCAFTDGVSSRLSLDRYRHLPTMQVAQAALQDYGRTTDDATVVVARCGRLPTLRERREDCFVVRYPPDIVVVSQRCRVLTSALGMSVVTAEAIRIATSELAHNILRHAQSGTIRFSFVEKSGRKGLRIVASDQGPGIGDIESALRDGVSTKGGLGAGLAGARRLSDEFQIESSPGKGTTVTLTKWA